MRTTKQLPGSCQTAAKQFRGNCLAGRGVGFNCRWARCSLCFQGSERELNRSLRYIAAACQLSGSWPAAARQLPGRNRVRQLRGRFAACAAVAWQLSSSCQAISRQLPGRTWCWFNCCWARSLLCFQCSERELNQSLCCVYYIRDALMGASVGTTNPAWQLASSCAAAAWPETVSGSLAACAAAAWPDVVLVLIVVGRAVCCAFSALNGN